MTATVNRAEKIPLVLEAQIPQGKFGSSNRAAQALIHASTTSIKKGYNLKSSTSLRMQNSTATLENSLVGSYKTKHSLTTHDPAIMLLGIKPNELKTFIYPKTCT